MKSFSEDGEVNLHNRAGSAKSKERHVSKNNTMSNDTKDFIQKICYRKTASIDMTQYGFINDSKVNPMDCVIKPLREQLEKISVKSASVKRRKPSPSFTSPRTKVREIVSPTTSPRTKVREVVSPIERKPACTPKSAMTYPGMRSSRSCFRKVRIQSNLSPVSAVTKEKKVKLVSPGRSKGKNVGKKKCSTKKK